MVKHSKGDGDTRTLRISGRHRTALKFIIQGMLKHSDPCDMHAVASNDGNGKKEITGDSEMSSEDVEDVECEMASNSTKGTINNGMPKESKHDITQGSILCFKKKPFFNTFDTPTHNNETVDNLLNELTEERKKSKNKFFASNKTCCIRKQNHFMQVPAGDRKLSTHKLSKCVKSVTKSGGYEIKRAASMLKSTAKEHPAVFQETLLTVE